MKFFALLFSLFFVLGARAQTTDKLLADAKKYEAQEDYKKALSLVTQALEKDSRNWVLYQKKGLYYSKMGNAQGAYDAYSKAITLNPGNYSLYMERGSQLSGSSLFKEAIEDYDQAIDLAPNDSAKYKAYMFRGSAKNVSRDFAAAYADFMKVYAYDSSNLDLLNDLALVCLEYDKKPEAIRLFYKIVAIRPDYKSGYANLGYALQLCERYQESTEALDKALEMNPKNAYSYSNRSYNKMKLGDLGAAMKDVEKSIKLDPYNSYAFRNRALIYMAMGEKAKACADLILARNLGFLALYGKEVEDLLDKSCK